MLYIIQRDLCLTRRAGGLWFQAKREAQNRQDSQKGDTMPQGTRTRPYVTLALLVILLGFVLSAQGDRNVTLASSSCTADPNSSTISCTWGDNTGCRLSASDSFAGSYCIANVPKCRQRDSDSGPGSKTAICCLMNTTINDACNAFTGPVVSTVTSCIKPPPCDPMSICP